MRIHLLHYFMLIFCATASVMAQDTLLLQPDSAVGKDAYFRDYTPDTNRGASIGYDAAAWTVGGITSIARSVLDFDLMSSIPAGSVIHEAYLSLYNDKNSFNNSGNHSGANACVLNRITEPWDEWTITWNNQPAVTNVNEVILPQSTSPDQHYTDIDVTAMVQDMINNPSGSFGIRISLVTEVIFSCMVFASSDHPNPAKHPKLEVIYTPPVTGVAEGDLQDRQLRVYPNPAADGYVWIDLDERPLAKGQFGIYDNQGRLVKQWTGIHTFPFRAETAGLSSGMYLGLLESEGQLIGRSRVVIR